MMFVGDNLKSINNKSIINVNANILKRVIILTVRFFYSKLHDVPMIF